MENHDITLNEWEIVQALRGMKPLDQLLIVKKSPKSEQEFEVKTTSVMFFFKNLTN